MKRVLFLVCCLCTLSSFGQSRMIRSGEIWPDDRGQHINAHGGGILQYQDTYYWFGEHKSERTSDALVGVTCYASDDLVHWRYCGVARSPFVRSKPSRSLQKRARNLWFLTNIIRKRIVWREISLSFTAQSRIQNHHHCN